jgi:hypothetical protein
MGQKENYIEQLRELQRQLSGISQPDDDKALADKQELIAAKIALGAASENKIIWIKPPASDDQASKFSTPDYLILHLWRNALLPFLKRSKPSDFAGVKESDATKVLAVACGVFAELLSQPNATAESPVMDEYRSADWFARATNVRPSRLRKAASKQRKSKRVRSKTEDGVVMYSVNDAHRWWPDDMKKTPTTP